jgi:hypothetical protein
LDEDWKRARCQPKHLPKDISVIKNIILIINRFTKELIGKDFIYCERTGRPPIFDDTETQRLEGFITRDSRTRRLGWEAIRIEMGYACSAKSIKNVVALLGYYHKRVARRKFNIRSYNKPLRVAWCQAHLRLGLWGMEMSIIVMMNHPDCVDETFE